MSGEAWTGTEAGIGAGASMGASGQASPAADPCNEPARRGTHTVRMRLAVLAVAAILPMMAVFGCLAYGDYRADRTRAGQRQLELARSMSATVERELHGALASLKALALSPSLQQEDLAGFRDLAERFVATEPAGAALRLLDRAGQHLLDTDLPASGTLLRRNAAVNLAMTERVFATAQPMISNLYHRASDGMMIVTADMPVLLDGRVRYDLSLVLPVARFERILAEQHQPKGAVVSIFDRDGNSVARVPESGRPRGQKAAPELLAALQASDAGILSAETRDGVPVLAAYSHTHPSGWSVAIGVPESYLRQPLLRSLRIALGAGTLALLFSLLIAYRMAQRVLHPIRALTAFAARPAAASDRSFGLLEVDQVADALRHSLRDRQAAIDSLQALNGELEARVRREIASREQAQAQLAQSQRMEALGQLAGGIAHDFNNVLQAVSGGLALIKRRARDPAAVDRLAGMAADAAARGAAITGRLLTFARRGELAGVAIEPAALLDSVRLMLEHTVAKATISIRTEVADGLPCLLADKAQLETVLINLAINARDAMPSGGEMVLQAAAEVVSAAEGHPGGVKPGRYVRLSFVDSGTGMTPDVLTRASEPFFTTKEPGHGTGLGLAMARGFAQQSGGGFAIASTFGSGTTVSLWFQEADAAVPAGEHPADAPDFDSETGMHVLLVDDDGMVREIMAGELDARGFVVTTAADPAAALALLDGGQPADVMITDYAMPGLNGLALIAEARRRRPALPALLLTGYAEGHAEMALTEMQDRLTLLLRKPIGGEELAARAASLRRRPVGV